MPQHYYTLIRRKLRRDLTPAEVVLWNVLRNRQFQGLKWRRQHTVGNYIVDFYCAEARLVIEAGGDYAGAEYYSSYRKTDRSDSAWSWRLSAAVQRGTPKMRAYILMLVLNVCSPYMSSSKSWS